MCKIFFLCAGFVVHGDYYLDVCFENDHIGYM
jgi:hypothetical protein